MKKILTACLIASGLAIAVISTGVLPLNLSFARASIEAMASAVSGLRIELDGNIRLRLGVRPNLQLDTLTIRATPDASTRLASVAGLGVSIGLIDLLRGRLHFREISLDTAVVDYCAESPSRSNAKADSELPSLAVTSLTAGPISVHCSTSERDDPTIATLRATAPVHGPMQIDVETQLAEHDVQLSVTTDALNDLLRESKSLPLTATLSASSDSVVIDGKIFAPFDAPRLTAAFSLTVHDARDWISRADVKIRRPADVRFAGQIQADASQITISQSSGSIADMDFELIASLLLDQPLPVIEIDADIANIDLTIVDTGAAAATAPNETLDLAFALEALKKFNARIDLRIGRIDGLALDLTHAELAATLADGVLDLSSFAVRHAETRLTASAQLDTRAACPAFTANAGIDTLTTAVLNTIGATTAVDTTIGRVDADLESCGESLAEHRESTQANVRLVAAVVGSAEEPFLKIDSLAVASGWQKPGRLEITGELNDEPVTVTASFASIAALTGTDPWPLAVTVGAADGQLAFTGDARYLQGDADLVGDLEVTVPRLGKTSTWTGFRPDADMPMSLTTNVRIQNRVLNLNDIELRAGQSDLAGRLVIDYNGDRPLGVVTLHSRFLGLSNLNNLQPEATVNDVGGGRAADRQPGWLEWQLPHVDFDLEADHVQAEALDFSRVSLRGRMRDQVIEDARLTLQLEETNFTGTLDVDLHDEVRLVRGTANASNVDVGKLLNAAGITAKGAARAERLDVDYSTRGENYAALVANARVRVDVHQFHWQPQESAAHRVTSLAFKELSMTAAPDAPVVWRSTGSLNGVPGRIRVETPSLTEIFAAQGALPVSGALLAADDVLLLDAVLTRENFLVTAADITISGETIDPATIELANLQHPLSEFQLVGRLTIDDTAIAVPGFVATTGTSQVEGRGHYSLTVDPRLLEAELSSPHLQTDDFAAITSRWRSQSENTNGDTTGVDVTENSRDLIDAIIDLLENATQRTSFDIGIDVADLYSGNDRLGAAKLQIRANEDELHLGPLRIAFPGGDVDVDYRLVRNAGRVEADIKVFADRLAYGGLLKLFDVESDANGLVYLDVALHSTAPDVAAIPFNYQGHVDLAVAPKDIEAGILDLWASNVVLAVLPTPLANDPKKMNCLVGRFAVKDGVMQSKNTMLDTTDVIVRGRGSIDLGNQQLDLIFAPQAKREKFLSISTPVAVTGPFDDYRLKVNPGGLVVTGFRWWLNLIYVPYKWLTGERFPADGLPTCLDAMDWESTPENIESIRTQLDEM